MWVLKCDICGREIEDEKRAVINKRLGKFEADVDVCPECFARLVKHIKQEREGDNENREQ